MSDFLVTLTYGRFNKKQYLVEGVASHEAARKHVRTKIILYDPGVPVEVVETSINTNKSRYYVNLGGSND